MITDVQDFIDLVNDGRLTILDRPVWLTVEQTEWAHLANASDFNAAVKLLVALLGHTWLWTVSYDNLAVLTRRDDPAEVIRSISLSPAHALLVGLLMAWAREGPKIGA